MGCKKCEKKLTTDEIAMTKKMIGRESKEFYCLDCMAEHFGVKRRSLEEKVEYFKKSGCMLFRENIHG